MPEEINRILTDHLSRWLFCPTQTAVQNLHREGIAKNVHLTGDVMLDAVLYNRKLAEERSRILEQLQLDPRSYLLVTLHRAENTDDPRRLKSIVAALNELSVSAVFPMHPRTRDRLRKVGLSIQNPLVKVIEPVGYLDMLQLEANAMKILTDSGGVQKEAFFLQVPVITLRDETEWIETVEQGANRLTGANKEAILEAVERFEVDYTRVSSVFGDGRAAERIVDHLMRDIEL
jgi:UDP-GlcNAc3NAcA epimerase